MTRIHYHIRLDHQLGTVLLFVISFHYDCEVIVIDRIGIHPIRIDGIVGPNVAVEDQVITDDVYNDIISMLHQDGLC